MSADQYKQIGIRRGATLFNMETVFIEQNGYRYRTYKNHRSQWTDQKNKKNLSCFRESLDLYSQLFRETVPLIVFGLQTLNTLLVFKN
jgi:hypothetical protein